MKKEKNLKEKDLKKVNGGLLDNDDPGTNKGKLDCILEEVKTSAEE